MDQLQRSVGPSVNNTRVDYRLTYVFLFRQTPLDFFFIIFFITIDVPRTRTNIVVVHTWSKSIQSVTTILLT